MITIIPDPDNSLMAIRKEFGGGRLPGFAPEAAPRLVSTSPVDNDSAAPAMPLIRLTFDQPIVLSSSGSITISDGTTQDYINPATGLPGVRVLGATHTLQVPVASVALGGGGYYIEFSPPSALKDGLTYFVQFGSNIISSSTGVAFGGLTNASMLNFTTFLDAIPPSALSASVSNPAGAYKAGDVINITVNFSETVKVTGTPSLHLDTGHFATLSGPSSGTSLNFAYTVQAGDASAQLGFSGVTDLVPGITDMSGNPLTVSNVAFSTLGGAGGSSTSQVVIDTSAPSVLAWNVVDGSTDIAPGSTLQLNFNENIQSSGAGSQLFVNKDGVTTALALTDPSISISGSSLFLSGLLQNTKYVVTLSPGGIADKAGNPVAGSPQISFGTSATVPANDTIAPGILEVTAAVGSTPTEYAAGNVINVQVLASEAVLVTGVPALRLQLANSNIVEANYVSGSGGKTLVFAYTVAAGDNAASLDYVNASSLVLNGGATITDVKGNTAVLTLATPGAAHSLDFNTNLSIDTPPIVKTALPLAGTAGVPLSSNLVFTFSEGISLLGNAANFKLYRDDLSGPVLLPVAVNVSGSTLTIDPNADLDLNKNYHLEIDAFSIGDATGKSFIGITGSTAYAFDTTVDSTPPTASQAQTTNAAGTYGVGSVIHITVTFSETVNPTGSPKLELNLGTGHFATLSSATPGTTLDFAYTVQAGDNVGALSFNDVTDLVPGIVDLNNNALDAAHISFSSLLPASGGGYGSGIVIDTTAPSSASWNVVDGSTDVAPGSSLQLTFNENIVSAGGSNQLTLSKDGVSSTLSLSDPSVTISGNHLTLSGLVQNTHYVVTLAGNSVADLGGNKFAASSQIAFATTATIPSNDTIAPGVLEVTAPVGATPTEYGVGATVYLQVLASEPVVVTGTPALCVNLDSGAVDAWYVSGSGSKTLVFAYTVAAGDNTASLANVSTGSLVLKNSSNITDVNGNGAVLTLAAPGAAHSLDFNTNITIDTPPILSAATPTAGASAVSLSGDLSLVFSEAITMLGSAANFKLYRDDLSGPVLLPVAVSVSGHTLTINPNADLDLNKNYHLEIDAAAIGDSTGKSYAGITGSTAYAFDTTVDVTPPSALSAKTTDAAGTYNEGDVIHITVTFSEKVNPTGSPKLGLNLGAGHDATLTSAGAGTTLDFAYTVQAGDTIGALNFGDLTPLASGIVDMSNNALDVAHISFSTLGAAAGGGYGSGIVIDTTAPTALSWNVTNGATDVSSASPLVLTFSENVVVNDPNATLFMTRGGSNIFLPLNDPSITISGTTLSMTGLLQNTTYSIIVGPGSVMDAGGNLQPTGSAISFATAATVPANDTIAPTVLDVTASGATDRTLGSDDTINLLVTMSEPMTVSGYPLLKLQVGSSVVNAVYSGMAGNALVFNYGPSTGQNTESLAYVDAGSLVLNGASITDIKGNAAVLSLPAVGAVHSLDYNTNVIVDTVPIVLSTSPLASANAVSVASDLVFTFSEGVILNGDATNFRLYSDELPSPVQVPVVASISGNVLTLNPVSDLSLNKNYYVEIDNTALKDNHGNPYAGLTGNAGYTFNTTPDISPPYANAAHTTNPAGTYHAGDVISIVVNFSETVTVTGTPKLELQLNSGAGHFATLTGATTGTSLTFAYTVQAGDNSSSLNFYDVADLASGISDLSSNALDLGHINFTFLNDQFSGGYGSNLVIDTTGPSMVSSSPADNYMNASPSGNIDITFDENIVLAGSTANIRLYNDDVSLGSTLIAVTISISGNVLTIDPNANLGTFKDYHIEIDSNALTDASGNPFAGIIGITTLNFSTYLS